VHFVVEASSMTDAIASYAAATAGGVVAGVGGAVAECE
jgi:hypothetical protein